MYGVIEFRDLGVMPYAQCWRLQQQLFDALLESKKQGGQGGQGSQGSQGSQRSQEEQWKQEEQKGQEEQRKQEEQKDLEEQKVQEEHDPKGECSAQRVGYILMVEHPAVYTLGKSGKSDNILFSQEQLKEIGADYFHIDRGGDVTFHGPGQILLYPILDLERLGIGLKQYIWALEQAVIETVAHWSIKAERCEGAAGVWIVKGAKRNKICAIGVRSSRYVTMHGLAMNVETDLNFFNYINPCGFTDRGVTSLECEVGSRVSFEEAKELLLNNLIKILNVKIYKK